MTRTARLFDLLQCLRGHRLPVGGAALAARMGISLRSLYRDIATLQAQGAQIEGAPGVGYVLRPGFTLPPLMFSEDEIEALVLGSRWVVQRADPALADAARKALDKIAHVLPPRLRYELENTALMVAPRAAPPAAKQKTTPPVPRASTVIESPELPIDPALLRHAIRHERKTRIFYSDVKGKRTSRVVWPFAMGFFDHAQMLAAWCEKRQAIRHFRLDRISLLLVLPDPYPRKRQALLKEWKAQQGIPLS